MKKAILFALMFATVHAYPQHGDHPVSKTGYADSVNAGLIKEDKMKGSPTRMAMADIGDVHVHMTYGSPGVKGREIWGGLVSYDMVWSAGAHSATWVSFSKPVLVDGRKLDAGTYGFFVIPRKGKWTVIFNSDAVMHLADEYEESKDVLRLEVKTEDLPSVLPRLTYEVKETGTGRGHIRYTWEMKRFTLPIRPA